MLSLWLNFFWNLFCSWGPFLIPFVVVFAILYTRKVVK